MPKAVTIKDKIFEVSISHETIQEAVQKTGRQISLDFAGKNPLFLAILNGSFMFASDLLKCVEIECHISFTKLSSYKGTKSTGNMRRLIGIDDSIKGRHIIIVEDIVDTGFTLDHLIKDLEKLGPASVNVASLLLKPEALQFDHHVKYKCFEVPNDFLVGYGLDYDGYGRNLPDIYKLTEEI